MVKVSIIIPTFNRANLITRALESVFKQTISDYEIIIIDDGSTDNTKDVLKPFQDRIRYVYQQNKGISAARNLGITMAQGQYIAFLDSDDTWIPEKLALQAQVLDENPTVGIVYSKMVKINEQGQPCGMKPENPTGRNFKELLEIGGDIPTSTVFTRKACFDKAGLFDENLPMMEDFEMWLRIAKHYDIYEIADKTLSTYYHHGQQITKNTIVVYESLIKLRQKFLKLYPNEAPVKKIKQQIAESHYTLSRSYFDSHYYDLALGHLFNALNYNIFVASMYFNEEDSPFTRLIKIIKPFGYFILCVLKYLFALLTFSIKKLPQKQLNKNTATLPLITVVVPIFNRVEYLEQAINSILKQGMDNIEIIIVDDGSTEDIMPGVTLCIAKAPDKIRYMRQINKGPGGARNQGIRSARGKYIAFLDADDEWLEGFLPKTTAKLESGIYQWADCAANRVVFNNKEEIIEQKIIHNDTINLDDNLYAQLLKDDIVGSPSKVVVTKSCFDKVGCFREDLRIREDWEMWLRLAKGNFKLGRVNEPLYLYKIRQNSLTKTQNLRGLRCTYRVLCDYSQDAFNIDPTNRALYATQMWDLARHVISAKEKDFGLFFKSIIRSQLFNPSFSRIIKSTQSLLSGRYNN